MALQRTAEFAARRVRDAPRMTTCSSFPPLSVGTIYRIMPSLLPCTIGLAIAKLVLGDDHLLDADGALHDLVDRRVAVKARHRVLGIAVRAEDLHGAARGAVHGLAGHVLGVARP